MNRSWTVSAAMAQALEQGWNAGLFMQVVERCVRIELAKIGLGWNELVEGFIERTA